MEKAQLKRIFEFLEDKEEQNPPFMWKHMNDMPLTEKDLTIEGDLDLEYRNITSLPEGLKVNGYLNLYGCKYLKSLPKGLEVGGNLDLSETPITSLPEGLKVGGQLWLIGCDNLTSLPKGLEVGEDLHLSSDFLLRSHSDEEIREMIKPGFIKGEIYR